MATSRLLGGVMAHLVALSVVRGESSALGAAQRVRQLRARTTPANDEASELSPSLPQPAAEGSLVVPSAARRQGNALAEEAKHLASAAAGGILGSVLVRLAEARADSGGEAREDPEEKDGPKEEQSFWDKVKEYGPIIWQGVKDVLLSVTIWGSLTFMFAIYYENTKEYSFSTVCRDGKRHTPEDMNGRWVFHFCDCWTDPKMCFLSCMCPSVRWADTIRMAGLFNYWMAVILFMLCQIISWSPVGLAGYLPMMAVGMHFRQMLRHKFYIQGYSCKAVTCDCLTYSVCYCLAINQEARTLEEAYVVDHPSIIQAKEELMLQFEDNHA